MFKVRTQRLRSIVAERRWIALIIKMFFRPRMSSSSSARMNKSNFRLLTKVCIVHMAVYETVVHRDDDSGIQSLT